MRSKREADEFKGAKLRKNAGDEDVEGHAFRAAPDGAVAKAAVRNAGDEDVEGHSMLPNPALGRQLAKAREQEIQRSLRDRQFEQEARRPHKKD
jgi:hypothetical protein